VSLLAIGLLSIGASFWSLDEVISALLTSRILVQFIAQIFALHYLRGHRREIARPFRMWLYPVPSVIAFLGWMYIFTTSGWKYVGFGLLTSAAGAVAYIVWKMVRPRAAIQ
jgi:amino acid transporter